MGVIKATLKRRDLVDQIPLEVIFVLLLENVRKPIVVQHC